MAQVVPNDKPLVLFKAAHAEHTERKCYVCGKPFEYFGFSSNALGGIDNSSRRPVCTEHAKRTV